MGTNPHEVISVKSTISINPSRLRQKSLITSQNDFFLKIHLASFQVTSKTCASCWLAICISNFRTYFSFRTPGAIADALYLCYGKGPFTSPAPPLLHYGKVAPTSPAPPLLHYGKVAPTSPAPPLLHYGKVASTSPAPPLLHYGKVASTSPAPPLLHYGKVAPTSPAPPLLHYGKVASTSPAPPLLPKM